MRFAVSPLALQSLRAFTKRSIHNPSRFMMTSSAGKSLSLTPVEQNLRQLLLDVAKYIDSSLTNASPLELRFAGGWVRDKLLGIQSHDIDVAINSMTGFQFGLKMKEFLDVPGNVEKYKLGNQKGSGLHKIEANPEKSKHLETVTTKIYGLDIDLVNLRKETYSKDSRNPQMEFGTPQEDAERRDATVNALFYNLHTEVVEDFIGGCKDMEAKMIRTPLNPFQTFEDDPLRVLRVIRFASRLGYEIDPEAEECIRHPQIRKDFLSKITRERVGTELEKMLKGLQT
jgi:tRNA nucleotidyltransferase/poly(A) polymerase